MASKIASSPPEVSINRREVCVAAFLFGSGVLIRCNYHNYSSIAELLVFFATGKTKARGAP